MRAVAATSWQSGCCLAVNGGHNLHSLALGALLVHRLHTDRGTGDRTVVQ